MKLTKTQATVLALLGLNETLKDRTCTTLEILFRDLKSQDISQKQLAEYKVALAELKKLGFIKLYNGDSEPIDNVTNLQKKSVFEFEITNIPDVSK